MSAPSIRRIPTGWIAGAAALASVLAGLPAALAADTTHPSPPPASDTATATVPDQPLSGTPSPMWQTNDTVRALAVANGVVYAGGDFTAVRPPDSPAGVGDVPRSRIAAFDARTGDLITTFTASVDGRVHDLAVSPDGSRLYVAGAFTTVNGVPRRHIAALHLPSGQLVTEWAPRVSATVTAVLPTERAIYLGGDFTTVNGAERPHLAALHPTTGEVITSFTAATDRRAVTIALAPDGSRLLIGGTFTTVNGRAQHAIASLDPVTGELRPWDATGIIPTPQTCPAHVTDITIVDDIAYVAGEDEQAGCFDGTYAARIADGKPLWVSYCFGATQAIEVIHGWLYKGSHQRDCGYDPGGYVGPQEERDFTYHRLTAQSLTDGRLGHWSPNTNATTSDLPVGPRALASDGQQLFVGGDFTTVNNRPQQGLTRFRPGNDSAPERPEAPTVTATGAGRVTITVPAVADRDSGLLTYTLYRDGNPTPVATLTAESWPWTRPVLRFHDTGLTPGNRHTYTVVASDGTHSSPRSPASAPVTVTATEPGSYPEVVRATNPTTYWRLNDRGPTAADSSGRGRSGTYIGTLAQGASGAVEGDPAVTVDGSGYVAAERATAAPARFSQAVWFRTTTRTGGALLGFSSARTGTGTLNDRVVWMDNNGQLAFGLRHPPTLTGTSTFTYVRGPHAYSDGDWHLAVATYDGKTMALYVDGVLAASTSARHSGSGVGYLRVGYVDLTSFDTVYGINTTPRTAPNSFSFSGALDEVATWNRALTPEEIHSLWIAGIAGATRAG